MEKHEQISDEYICDSCNVLDGTRHILFDSISGASKYVLQISSLRFSIIYCSSILSTDKLGKIVHLKNIRGAKKGGCHRPSIKQQTGKSCA
jgi:hypothetical protein